MQLHDRINLLEGLGEFIESGNPAWIEAKQKAYLQNGWFMPAFIDAAAKNIVSCFLQRSKLEKWAGDYRVPVSNPSAKNVGLVMAGNIPLVGFHDFLSVFITGHRQTIKASSKDDVLIKVLVQELFSFDEKLKEMIVFSEMLKGCDAYIATGSNNSARYFDYYFSKYPHIIRMNRTSVAILTGGESKGDLDKLSDDICLYFGLGCRNVTKIFVPENYDFVPLLNALKKYNHFIDQHKYKNNYDYQLAILIINNKYYMTEGSILITENHSCFSPISCLHFEYYKDFDKVVADLKGNKDIQCIVGEGNVPFGNAQTPSLTDYADGVDTMRFLSEL